MAGQTIRFVSGDHTGHLGVVLDLAEQKSTLAKTLSVFCVQCTVPVVIKSSMVSPAARKDVYEVVAVACRLAIPSEQTAEKLAKTTSEKKTRSKMKVKHYAMPAAILGRPYTRRLGHYTVLLIETGHLHQLQTLDMPIQLTD